MIALAAFLARLLPALGSYFTWHFAAWHLAAFAGVVGVVLLFLDKILLALAALGGLVIQVVVRVVVAVLVFLLGKLPSVPEEWPAMVWSTITGVLAPANRYVPVDVFFDYLGIFASVYASLMVWKLIKFVRGGG